MGCQIITKTGAYKPLEAHETEFHDNPNYKLRRKDLKDDLANFIITMSYWSCIILYMASNNEILPTFFMINLECDGTWQAV